MLTSFDPWSLGLAFFGAQVGAGDMSMSVCNQNIHSVVETTQ